MVSESCSKRGVEASWLALMIISVCITSPCSSLRMQLLSTYPTQTFHQQGSLFRSEWCSREAVASACRPAGRTNEILGRLQRRRAAAGAQALARERKVSLMRKYRTGELPDVQQLSIAAFLAPLGKSGASQRTVVININDIVTQQNYCISLVGWGGVGWGGVGWGGVAQSRSRAGAGRAGLHKTHC